MKFSLSTLKEFLITDASLEEICDTLTKIGLEVESVDNKAENLNFFSVAKIVEIKPHENSNKLKICSVKISEDTDPIQIVCGAPNARSGIKVAFAPINSIIPCNQMKIKKTKIAGIESNGMLCSARELNLGNEDSGIIEVDDKFAIGSKISEVFDINDTIIEINITPNRGDCLGIYGIASDLSAAGVGKLKNLEITKTVPKFKFDLDFKNHVQADCPFITFRTIKNIKNCESPKWLKNKLENIGINSISAVVDSINYVMHILNRPMHAYDLEKTGNKIILNRNSESRNFTSLKKTYHKIAEDILTISNDNEILSIAGVIGSEASSCSMETKEILIESAFFLKEIIAKSGRSLNILSDSRHRFERGVDYKTCIDGIEMVTTLILDLCGGDASEIFIDNIDIIPKVISFNFSQFKKLIGIDIEKSKAKAILESLEFKVDDNFNVEIPSKRHDISSSEDLIEEILRIYGYNNINKNSLEFNKKSALTYINKFHKTRILLASKGLTETISWSFVDEKNAAFFTDKNPSLLIKNPISQDLGIMRPNLVMGLINSYQKNYLRNISNLSIFEIGNVFENQNIQKHMISGLRAGNNLDPNRFNENRLFDFYDVKKDLYDIADLFGIKTESLSISSESAPKYYHPHRFARFKIGKNIFGFAGEINPQINKVFDIKHRLYVFEIYSDSIVISKKPVTKQPFIVNDLPIVERDFSFLVDKDIAVGDMIKSLNMVDKKLIKDVVIFDIYSGEKIDSLKKSVALKVKIQPTKKTLTSLEIDLISSKIIENMSQNFNAKIRDS